MVPSARTATVAVATRRRSDRNERQPSMRSTRRGVEEWPSIECLPHMRSCASRRGRCSTAGSDDGREGRRPAAQAHKPMAHERSSRTLSRTATATKSRTQHSVSRPKPERREGSTAFGLRSYVALPSVIRRTIRGAAFGDPFLPTCWQRRWVADELFTARCVAQDQRITERDHRL